TPLESPVIKSAGRVFEVLEFFREARRPLSVRDIAEHFGYPLSSTSVLVKSIAELGYLSYDSRSRVYSVTIRVAMLGDWIYESSFGGTEIIALMEDLSRRTSETVILAVQNDIFVQYVRVIQSTLPIQFYISAGTRRPLCMSGTGWALLSTHTDAAIERLVQRTENRLDKAGLNQPITLEEVTEKVAHVRKHGYVYSRGTNTPGAGVIASPLPGAVNGARLVIGIGGPTERLDDNEQGIARHIKLAVKAYAGGRGAPLSVVRAA
ncbi:MAG TPA: IclR family transcriptional regulator, partial [Ramlibacter sp.]|nr:IclR family transcriptional regulator [Ramlibacter sp.]